MTYCKWCSSFKLSKKFVHTLPYCFWLDSISFAAFIWFYKMCSMILISVDKSGLPIPTKFLDIPEFYVPGQSIECSIRIDEEFVSNVTRRDWIGLFEVGWKYLHSYITFEWVSVPQLQDGKNVMVVKFNSRTLPAKPKVNFLSLKTFLFSKCRGII